MKQIKETDNQLKKKSGIKKNKKWFKGTREGRTKCNLTNKLRFWKFKTKSPSILLLANIQLNTGDHETAIVRITAKSFKLYGKRYLIDDDYLYYNRTFKMWASDYHEDISLPISRKIPANLIKDQIKASDLEVTNNVNPAILEDFTTSKVIEKVFQGQEMDSFFRFIKVMIILCLIASGGTLIILLNQFL